MGIPTRYLLGGAGLYAGVATAAYIRVKSNQCPEVCEHAKRPDGQAFNALADTYDEQIGWDEKLMGITLLRWMLLRQAKGDVLEVSAGTGRNLSYYNSLQVNSVTMTDTSKNMLWHARQKHDRHGSTLPVKFCLADAQRLVSGPSASQAKRKHEAAITSEQSQHASRLQDKLETFSPAQFDTVIDTFGLCSHEDPKAALQQMAAVCKPGGQLILLQHGKASWGWLNHRLDDEAQAHFAKWGCWWNRDILQLVHEAGLIVESCSRWHFGTTYVIKAKPPLQNILSFHQASTGVSTQQDTQDACCWPSVTSISHVQHMRQLEDCTCSLSVHGGQFSYFVDTAQFGCKSLAAQHSQLYSLSTLLLSHEQPGCNRIVEMQGFCSSSGSPGFVVT